MLKMLKNHLPAMGASVAFTGAVLGGYVYYVQTVVIPAEIRAGQQREKAPEPAARPTTDEALRREVFAASVALLPAMALLQTTPLLLPLAMGDGGASAPVAVTPGTVARQPVLAALPATTTATPQFLVDTLPAPAPLPPAYTPPPQPAPAPAAPEVVVVYVEPPPPKQEPVPSVPVGSYWAAGSWNYNRANNNFTWSPGQVLPTPTKFVSSTSRYVPAQWVRQGSGYVLVPAHWENLPATTILAVATAPGGTSAPTFTSAGRIQPPPSFSSAPAYTNPGQVPVTAAPVTVSTGTGSTAAGRRGAAGTPGNNVRAGGGG